MTTFEEQKNCPIKLECPICNNSMHFFIDKDQTLEDIDKWFNCLDRQKVLDAFEVLCRIYGISKEYQDAFIKDVGL